MECASMLIYYTNRKILKNEQEQKDYRNKNAANDRNLCCVSISLWNRVDFVLYHEAYGSQYISLRSTI